MSAPERHQIVDVIEAYHRHKAGGDYASTRAQEGRRPGEWHHSCPGCGGGLTISTDERGRTHLTCRTAICDEAAIVAVLDTVPLPGDSTPEKDPSSCSASGAKPVIPAADVPPLSELLEGTEQTLRRYVAMSDPQFTVLSLWTLHTHALEAADATPYIAISSAEKQSGKSRLFEVLELLVARPWMTGRVTVAVLARKIDRAKPTLLLDESDAAFGGDPQFAEGLRGILNTGHRPSGKSTICVGQGANLTDQDFSTYCPKAFAGIGDRLPDTIVDRAISIRLKRRAPSEQVDRFRYREAFASTQALRDYLEAWGQHHTGELEGAEPELPDELSDRAQDASEPLLAIADLAGGDWPARARAAAIELAQAGMDDGLSRGVQLLIDIRDAFAQYEGGAASTRAVLEALNANDESPWGAWHSGEGMKPRDLARLLKPYAIKPRTVRIGGETAKGYKVEQFEDAWTRLLPEEASHASPASHLSPDAERDVTDVTDVTDFSGTSMLTGDQLVERLKAEFDATEVAA